MSTRTEQSEMLSAAPPRHRPLTHPGQVSGERTGQLLGVWREHELARAKRTRVCRGLDIEHIEDLYQDTTEVLLGRAFRDEEHLRHALRHGIRYRALEAHRNRKRHTRTWERAAPAMQVLARVTQGEQSAEALILAEEDRLIASEFLAELSGEEPSVYWLMSVEHLRHINIARALGIPTTQARNTMRACERKRERFQTLFDSGRLCGYRAQTIKALQEGESTSSDLARQALAHIQSCPHCHRAHGKLERDLRHAMQQQIAAVLPIPVLTHYTGLLHAPSLPLRAVYHQLLARPMSIQASTGERATALLTNGTGKAAGRLATGIGLIAALAGTVGATHLITTQHNHPQPHHSPSRPTSIQAPPQALAALRPRLSTPGIQGHPPHTATTSTTLPFGPGYAVSPRHTHKRVVRPRALRAQATVLRLWRPARTTPPPRREPQQTGIPGGGGEFSP